MRQGSRPFEDLFLFTVKRHKLNWYMNMSGAFKKTCEDNPVGDSTETKKAEIKKETEKNE